VVIGLLLLSLLGALPSCALDSEEARALQLRVNLERFDTGLRPLVADPVLCEIAGRRAVEVAASGSTDADLQHLNRTRREVYRLGYVPHSWTESSLILNPGDPPLSIWKELKPEAYAEAMGGDYEHLGVGLALHEGRPVYSLVFGLSKRTFDWRRVEPLADLASVRIEILERVNLLRSERGRAALEAQPQLDLAALRHARDLLAEGYYAHRSLDGKGVRERARAAGFNRSVAISENIAKGLFSPAEVVRRWMDSPGHRDNILKKRFSQMGSAVAFGDTEDGLEVIWVQVLSGPG
jgi:uncharacterized protein YkwD